MRLLLAIITLLFFTAAVFAQDVGTLVNALGQGDFKQREAAVTALIASPSDATVPLLEALATGNLYIRKSDQKIFITAASGDVLALTDPVTMAAAGEAAKAGFDKVKVNNALRKTIQNALGALTLFSADIDVRRKAANNILKSGDPTVLSALEKAISGEKDSSLAELLRYAAASATLRSDRPEAEKISAISVLKTRTDRDTSAMLVAFAATAEGGLKAAAQAAAQSIEGGQAKWTALQNIWYGLSLSSVLLLAAIQSTRSSATRTITRVAAESVAASESCWFHPAADRCTHRGNVWRFRLRKVL